MSRHEITDQQWEVIKPLLPVKKTNMGRPLADPRRTLNGMLYVLKTGCPWADMPRKYGSPTTCWRRLQQWTEDGTWDRIWRALLSQLDAQTKIEWVKHSSTVLLYRQKKGVSCRKNQVGEGLQSHGSGRRERSAYWCLCDKCPTA
jgi:transposase